MILWHYRMRVRVIMHITHITSIASIALFSLPFTYVTQECKIVIDIAN